MQVMYASIGGIALINMEIIMKTLNTLALSLIALSPIAIASPDLADEQGPVKGIRKVINHIQNKTQIPVFIPQHYPFVKVPLSAYMMSVDAQSYYVSIDQNSECRGAKFCTVGSFRAEIGGLPSIHYNMENQEMTEPVMLENQTKAYFTQAYALGSFNPPTLTVRCRNVLYTFTWNEQMKEPKQQLIQLANDALAGAKC